MDIDHILKMYRENPALRASAKRQRELIDLGQDIISSALYDGAADVYYEFLNRYRPEPGPPRLIIVAESPPKPRPGSPLRYSTTLTGLLLSRCFAL